MLALTAAIGLSTGGWRAAVWGTLAMFGVGVVGYWDLTMITLSLMIVGDHDRAGDRHPARHLDGPLRPWRAAAAAASSTPPR